MAAALTVKQHNEQVLKELEPGDMVEFPKGVYSHWGVYVGESKIIHLTIPDNDGASSSSSYVFSSCGKSYDKAYVREQLFLDVVKQYQGCRAKKNNDKDRDISPQRASDIIRQARSMLGKIEYNVLWNNCEHFAAFCRYGKKWSEQADKFLKGVAVTGALAVVGGLLWQAWKGDGPSNDKNSNK